MPQRFNPQHLDRLLSPERRKIMDPEKVLAYLKLQPGMILADVGVGPGYFALEAARLVAPDGRVIGIDVAEEMLQACRQRAREAGLDNVETVLAEADDEFPVHTATADAILLANVYHEADPTSGLLSELRRIIKPGGVLLLVEWLKEPTPMGPPLDERVDAQDALEEFTTAGFVLDGTCEIGPYNYGLKFYRPGGAEPMDTPVL